MSISFQGMGNEGRLGNQMFQYAFVRGVAANRGFDWVIPILMQTDLTTMVCLKRLN